MIHENLNEDAYTSQVKTYIENKVGDIYIDLHEFIDLASVVVKTISYTRLRVCTVQSSIKS